MNRHSNLVFYSSFFPKIIPNKRDETLQNGIYWLHRENRLGEREKRRAIRFG